MIVRTRPVMLLLRKCFTILLIILLPGVPFSLFAQNTVAQWQVFVSNQREEPIPLATVILENTLDGSRMQRITNERGLATFTQVKPGEGYQFRISHTGYRSTESVLFSISLDAEAGSHVIMQEETRELATIKIVSSRVVDELQVGIGTSMGRKLLSGVPTVSRELHEFIRLAPQAGISADGGFSLAGQFVKYNSFYIDGANSNDIHGLSLNGILGGRTGSTPVSLESVQELKVLINPMDVQYSGFTGGAINAITKSGSNHTSAAAWHYFRNEQISGRSPVPVEKPGEPGVFERSRLPPFVSRQTGFSLGGALVKNKAFYYLLAEWQLDENPTSFSMSDYRGALTTDSISKLTKTLLDRYGYNAGTYLNNVESLNAFRLLAKIDWNVNERASLHLTYRLYNAKNLVERPSGPIRIVFTNNGFILPSVNHSIVGEWRTKGQNLANQFRIAFNTQEDDQQGVGQPFPSITIRDRSARLQLGGNANSQLNYLKNLNLSVSDNLLLTKGRHIIRLGTDNEWNQVNDAIIPDYFGNYQFASMNDFISNRRPLTYTRSFPMNDTPVGDNTKARAKFSTLRLSVYVQDEFRVSKQLTVQAGLRADAFTLLDQPETDQFFNDTGIGKISPYYNLMGARSGQNFQTNVQVSPRLGIRYRFKNSDWRLRAGFGLFMGRIPNVWFATMFQNNGTKIGSLNLRPPPASFRFVADPYAQPTNESVGIPSDLQRGQLELISRKFRLPTVARGSLAVDKSFREGWTMSLEALYTYNLHELSYTNVNILPPAFKSAAPGERNVYAGGAEPARIPMTWNGLNPYSGQVYLMSNNEKKRGRSWLLTAQAGKDNNGPLAFQLSYTYGSSFVQYEPVRSSTMSQWVSTESVNGRNYLDNSRSDNDPGHRIMGWLLYRFAYAKGKLGTSVGLYYNGQSGSSYSHVYQNSMVNDNGYLDNSDLIYVPTATELAAMQFRNNDDMSADEQREAFEDFIEDDTYLRSRRGKFAERNASRAPFIHLIDLRIQQDVLFRMKKNSLRVAFIWEISNLANLLNKDWGRVWTVPGERVSAVRFLGFRDNQIPVYEFTSPPQPPYSISGSTNPWNSARWMSQIGIRISVDELIQNHLP